MAFSSLLDSLIQVGSAVKREIFTTLKDNQDDLNTRVSSLEGGASKVIILDCIVKNVSSASSLTGLVTYRVPFDFGLTDAKLAIFEVGSLTGTLEMDVRKASSLDDASAVSVFTTLPSINLSTASDFDESSNTVFNSSEKDLLAGEYLFIDISSLPSPVISKFQIYLIGEI